MSFQFHPLALGVMLLVAAGTVVFTILNLNSRNSNSQSYNYDTPYSSRRSSASDLFRFPEGCEDENEIRRRIEKCSICLRHLKGRALKQLRCQHEFHEHCINMWLNNHNTCPNCRKACT